MSLLNVEQRVLGKTIVQHEKDIPGLYDMKRLAQGHEPNSSTFIYEQRRDKNFHAGSTFLEEGYSRLPPVCDLGIVRNRQDVVRAFLQDVRAEKKYLAILNLMHLINEWTHADRRYEGGLPDLKIAAGFLERYVQEAEKLTKLLRQGGGFLEKLAASYEKDLPKEEASLLVRACKNGEFDSLIISKDNGGLAITGVVGHNKPEDVPHKSLGRFSLYDQTGGWTQPELVWCGFKKGLGMLNNLYSPLAALYFEATYMKRRQLEGKEVSLPRLNKEGKFEMVEGEPILYIPGPVTPRSFSFDQKNARSILNGLHSAGKTYLLCDIPLYILRALRGFSLPAKDSNIPLIKRIFHALEIEKKAGGGSLHSEMLYRAEEIRCARDGDLFLIDEFLQHASPDAAEPLEPIILQAYENTKAIFIIVDHRGESIEDGKQWQFWSPEYHEGAGEITPTFRFKKGKPSIDILARHAKQLLRKVASELDAPKGERKAERERENSFALPRGESELEFAKRIETRVLGGSY